MDLLQRLRRRKHCLWFLYYRFLRSREGFTLAGVEYPYFYHWYNRTWMNERAVEITFVQRIMETHPGASLLEVGNVLPHYFRRNHEVVDKYEKARGVLNLDILDFHPNCKYDVIVCISTLEHVGWDEPVRDPEKPVRALEHLKSLLEPKGILVATIPLGYNTGLDQRLRAGQMDFENLYLLKRTGVDNRWIETDQTGVTGIQYDYPYPNANALAIGVIGG